MNYKNDLFHLKCKNALLECAGYMLLKCDSLIQDTEFWMVHDGVWIDKGMLTRSLVRNDGSPPWVGPNYVSSFLDDMGVR